MDPVAEVGGVGARSFFLFFFYSFSLSLRSTVLVMTDGMYGSTLFNLIGLCLVFSQFRRLDGWHRFPDFNCICV